MGIRYNPDNIPSIYDRKPRLAAERKYRAHRDAMEATGHDPDWIGTTEVAAPCCPDCGKAIPWAVLKPYL